MKLKRQPINGSKENDSSGTTDYIICEGEKNKGKVPGFLKFQTQPPHGRGSTLGAALASSN